MKVKPNNPNYIAILMFIIAWGVFFLISLTVLIPGIIIAVIGRFFYSVKQFIWPTSL